MRQQSFFLDSEDVLPGETLGVAQRPEDGIGSIEESKGGIVLVVSITVFSFILKEALQTRLGDHPSVHDQYAIVKADSLKPVRDREELRRSARVFASGMVLRGLGTHSSFAELRLDDFLNQRIRLWIDRARRLIQNEHLASSYKRAQERHCGRYQRTHPIGQVMLESGTYATVSPRR